MVSERLEDYPNALKFNQEALRYEPDNQKLKTRQSLLKSKIAKVKPIAQEHKAISSEYTTEPNA